MLKVITLKDQEDAMAKSIILDRDVIVNQEHTKEVKPGEPGVLLGRKGAKVPEAALEKIGYNAAPVKKVLKAKPENKALKKGKGTK